MAYSSEKALAQAAAAEKDAIAYIDCIFHRRYADHLPLNVVLQDMTQLRNRNVLSHVGAMAFCQRAFLQTRTHLYKIYQDEIYICPKDYRDAVTNLVHHVKSREKTTLADLYSYSSAAYPVLIKGEIGLGLTVFKRFIEEHPAIFEIIELSPKEFDKHEVHNHAQVFNGVLLFPKIKIAVGRVVNISGNTAYLECQGEFIAFHAVSANLPSTVQLKTYITKGDMVPFEARYYAEPATVNGSSASVVLAAVGVSSTKLRNVWRAINVELPRNASLRHSSGSSTVVTTATVESATTSPRSPLKSPFDSSARRAGSTSSHRPSTTTADSISINSYMAPLDDATEWAPMCSAAERRRASVQPKQSITSDSGGAGSVPALVRRAGSAAAGRSGPSYGTTSSRGLRSTLSDAATQAGSGRPNANKEVQTDVTDEEIILKLIRKYPNLLDSMK